MASDQTVIAGIPIPSTDPLFLGGVAVHVALALACVVAGAVAMLSRKRAGRHPRFGTIYYWTLAGVFATATALALVRWAHDYHLFLLGAGAFIAATVGRQARRRQWRGWARIHITGMGASYVLMLTAFYVDNGKSLPVWRDLPVIAYWLAPTLAGAPIIAWALARHPLVRAASRT